MNEPEACRQQGVEGGSATAAKEPGKEPGKHCGEKSISASPLGSCAPIQLSSQEPQRGSHTAIFKTDKNQACPIVSFVVTDLGFARARPNELRPNSALAALGPLCQGLCFSELLLAGSREKHRAPGSFCSKSARPALLYL